MPCCEISDCAQMSKTIIAVRHFGLGGRESLETAVTAQLPCMRWHTFRKFNNCLVLKKHLVVADSQLACN